MNLFSKGLPSGPIPRNLLEDHSFQKLLNCLDIGLFISDSFCNKLISFTNNLETLLGYTSLELKREPGLWGQTLRSEDGSRLDEILIHALDRRENVDFDLNIRDKQGNKKRLWISLLNCGDLQSHEILGQVQDVTSLREKEIALAKMESLESEISARIQKQLLLGVPRNVPQGLKIHAGSIPSQRVDGDFYDFNRMNENILDFFIGDVMGKGLNAALLGAGAKNLFNKAIISLLTAGNERPAIEKIVDLTDSYLTKELIRIKSFITLNYGRLDMDRTVFRYIDCGHNPAIHYNKRQDCCWILKGNHMPLGFKDHQRFHSSVIPLEKGDLLFLYSDGITECVNSHDEPFGLERLIHLIKGFNQMTPIDLVNQVINLGFNYSQSGFDDDATTMAIKVEESDKNYLYGQINFSLENDDYRAILKKNLDVWNSLPVCDDSQDLELFKTKVYDLLDMVADLEKRLIQKDHALDSLEVLHSIEDQDNTGLHEGLYWTVRDEDLYIEIYYRGQSITTDIQMFLAETFDSITLAESLGYFRRICGRKFFNKDRCL